MRASGACLLPPKPPKGRREALLVTLSSPHGDIHSLRSRHSPDGQLRLPQPPALPALLGLATLQATQLRSLRLHYPCGACYPLPALDPLNRVAEAYDTRLLIAARKTASTRLAAWSCIPGMTWV